MAGKIPPALKPVRAFLLRAQEMEKSKEQDKDVYVYMCRTHAMGKVFEIPGVLEQPGVKEYVTATMDGLEKLKKENEMLSDKEACAELMKTFAINLFKKSDDVYNAGLADKGTARKFYVAASFLEVADPNDPELENLRKYAKLKAAEIMIAIKEGRTPLPPQTEEEDESGEVDAPLDFPATPAAPPAAPASGTSEQINEAVGFQRAQSYREATPVRRKTQLEPKGNGGTKETKMAEGFTREAIRFLQTGKELKGAEKLCSALEVLANGKHAPKISPHGVRDENRNDAIEFSYFAARTLELSGQTVTVEEGIDRAVDLLSNALHKLET